MHIIWNHVTRLSQIVALVLAIGIFFLGFYLGVLYSQAEGQGADAMNKQFQEAMFGTTTTR